MHTVVLMTDDARPEGTPARGGEQGEERRAPREAEGRPKGVPAPSPEEAPELLGERSDYPIAWDPAADDGER